MVAPIAFEFPRQTSVPRSHMIGFEIFVEIKEDERTSSRNDRWDSIVFMGPGGDGDVHVNDASARIGIVDMYACYEGSGSRGECTG